MKSIKKNIRRSIFIFSLTVVLIMLVTFTVTGLITAFFYAVDILKIYNFSTLLLNFVVLILNFCVVSIVIGTVFSVIIVKPYLTSAVEISEAEKRVIQGDYSMRVNENVRQKELRDMMQNFNMMTRELAATEIFRNDFVNNVSHEFKTPLSAINGYAAILQDETLSVEQREFYVSKIIYNTKRLSSLTDNILRIAKLENSEMPVKKENYSLDEQIREIILLYENEWTQKDIELDVELDTLMFCGNNELLSQVWQNIIGNAVKFTPEGGRIGVSLKATAGAVIFECSDTGEGMSEETLKRIFEKFYQGDSSHSDKGNGLGLALAKKIVDLHDGTIRVSSQKGVGSVFTVILPDSRL